MRCCAARRRVSASVGDGDRPSLTESNRLHVQLDTAIAAQLSTLEGRRALREALGKHEWSSVPGLRLCPRLRPGR